MRSVAEWQGKNDDQAIPPRVALRVIDRQRPAPGELPICPECTMPIRPGDGLEIDHTIPLIDGGQHAEGNLRAVHRHCHAKKTAWEAMHRAEARTRQKSAYGLKQPKGRPMPGTRASGIRKRFDGTIERWK